MYLPRGETLLTQTTLKPALMWSESCVSLKDLQRNCVFTSIITRWVWSCRETERLKDKDTNPQQSEPWGTAELQLHSQTIH